MTSRIDTKEIPPPDPYYKIRHWKWVVEQSLLPLAILVGLLAIMTIYLHMGIVSRRYALSLMLIGGALCVIRLIGIWVAWRIRPIEVDAIQGILTQHQRGYWWLMMSDSSPDPLQLDNISLVTDKSLLEQMFFRHSEKLTIRDGEKVIILRSVRDAALIVQAQGWRKHYELNAPRLMLAELRKINVQLAAQLAAQQGTPPADSPPPADPPKSPGTPPAAPTPPRMPTVVQPATTSTAPSSDAVEETQPAGSTAEEAEEFVADPVAARIRKTLEERKARAMKARP